MIINKNLQRTLLSFLGLAKLVDQTVHLQDLFTIRIKNTIYE